MACWKTGILSGNIMAFFKIVEVAKELRDLEPRALAYISAVSKTPKEQFRCYIWKQSNIQHWNF